MRKLLMISGDRALAEGKHGAFYNTMEEFHKYWDRIDVITPRVVRQSEQIFPNVFIHSSPWPILLQPLWIWKKARAIFKEEKFNLMTVHEYPPFYNGLGACLLFHKIKVPYVLEIMHIPGHPRAANWKEKVYRFLFRYFMYFDTRKAVAVRIVNQTETPAFLIKSGVQQEKLKYIPAFYIDLELFKPLDIKKEYDLVFAARLEKNKGILELLKAVKEVKKQKPDIKLMIIGSGPLKSGLESFVEQNNLKNNVVFSGWLNSSEDVARAYNSAKIFVNPSYNEGGPRVVLEAMACGLPVISTPVGLTHDIIQDGQNGLFTDWNPVKMAKDILALLDDQNMQQKFSSAGLELVKKFEKNSQIENYAKKLQELI